MLCAVGFSTRSLVQSIRRANVDVVAMDHFCDLDLRELAIDVHRIGTWQWDDPVGPMPDPNQPQSIPACPTGRGTDGDGADGDCPQAEVGRWMAKWVALNGHRPLPSIAAGGAENAPALIDVLCRYGPFLGPAANAMAELRSTRTWSELARCAGLRFPRTVPMPNGCPGSLHGRWLRKPERGGGGVGIGFWSSAAIPSASSPKKGTWNRPTAYLQEFIEGRSLGAVLIVHGPERGGSQSARQPSHKGQPTAIERAGPPVSIPPHATGGVPGDPNRGGTATESLHASSEFATVLGVTESWTAADWPGPQPFIYRGSWGPVSLPRAAMGRLLRLGDLLYQRYGNLGMIGADVVLDWEGNLWLLELNPRWTAGMEVLSDVGWNPVPWHLAAWSARLSQPSVAVADLRRAMISKMFATQFSAKAVVYAPTDIAVDRPAARRLAEFSRSEVCDIPCPPHDRLPLIIQGGQPVCTVKTTIPVSIESESRQGMRGHSTELWGHSPARIAGEMPGWPGGVRGDPPNTGDLGEDRGDTPSPYTGAHRREMRSSLLHRLRSTATEVMRQLESVDRSTEQVFGPGG